MAKEKLMFNYTNVFNEPLKVKQLNKNLSLPYFVKVSAFVTYLLGFGLNYLLFNQLYLTIGHFVAGSYFVLIFGIPYLLVRLIDKVHPDGKNVFVYLYDMVSYYTKVKLRHKKYDHDIEAPYVNELVVFEASLVAEHNSHVVQSVGTLD